MALLTKSLFQFSARGREKGLCTVPQLHDVEGERKGRSRSKTNNDEDERKGMGKRRMRKINDDDDDRKGRRKSKTNEQVDFGTCFSVGF